jgi:hypothetical protein
MAAAAHAQDDLNRSVDVAKEYMPLVERAQKLPVAPQMNDTTTLKPDFRYVVRPRAWVSRFEVAPIRAARIATAPPEQEGPLYAKLGGGAPGQTLADICLATKHTGVYVNHRGQWADIQRVTARTFENSAGVFGRLRVGRWTMGGELGVDHNSYADYLAAGRKLRYTMPGAAFTVEHDYFYLAAEGWMLQPRAEAGGWAYAEARRNFNEHFLRLGVSASAWNMNTVFGVSPRYEFDNQLFRFAVGAEVAHDDAMRKTRFLPEMELRLHGSLSPYLKLTGDLRDNSYRTLAALNPYLDPQFRFAEAPGATAVQRLRAGVSGRIGRVVAWNLYAGGEMRRNALLESSAAPYFMNKSDAFTAGLEAEAQTGGFTASLDAKYLKYKKLGDYLPAFESSLSVGYSCEKWAVRASAGTHGGYKFFGTETRAPAATDLALEAEYRLSKQLGIFVAGGNILNHKLYPYALHRGIGTTVGAGVKLTI